jgi:hypothetical protein
MRVTHSSHLFLFDFIIVVTYIMEFDVLTAVKIWTVVFEDFKPYNLPRK